MQVCTVSGNTADRLGKALQPIDHGDQDVLHAAGLQLVHHLQPELGAFALLDPRPENMFLALAIKRQRHIDRLVADQALVADLHPQRVEEDDGINRVERPVLPSRTSSSTASVTRLIRSGETSTP